VKVHLVSTRVDEEDAFFKRLFTLLAELASQRKHILVDSPEEADAILVTDADGWFENRRLRQFPLVRKYPNKVFYYCELASPLWLLPGVYTNSKRSILAGRRIRCSSYVSRQTTHKNKFVEKPDRALKKDIFFSFLGGSTSFVRKRLLRFNFGRPDIVIENTSAYQHWNLKQANRDEWQRKYVEIATRSRFVLCPRGAGTGIIRLFEMLEMGIVPVILSDGWVPPRGPKWEEFSIFVREREVAKLPEILENYEPKRREMERAARSAWERFFSPDKQFNQVIDAIEDIARDRIVDERWFRLLWPFLVARKRVQLAAYAGARRSILWVFVKLKIPFPYALNR